MVFVCSVPLNIPQPLCLVLENPGYIKTSCRIGLRALDGAKDHRLRLVTGAPAIEDAGQLTLKG